MNTQQERLSYCINKYVSMCLKEFDSKGKYIGQWSMPDERDRMRAALLLLDHGGKEQLQLAERFLLQIFCKDGIDYTLLSLEENFIDARSAITRDWNIFLSNDACYILSVHDKRLSTAVLDKLIRIAKRNFSRYAGSAQLDYLPHGYNDNMPAHAACGLILGGEKLNDQQAVDDGVYRLELFAQLLSRRAKASEYSSSNYLPLTIAHIAKIANYAKDPFIRELAQKIEIHLWADTILHHHIPTGRNANAQSRAYTWNSVGHADNMSCALWIATGYPKAWSPFDAILSPYSGQVLHFGGDQWKTMSDISTVITKFHVLDYLLENMENRDYPHQVISTSETGSINGGVITTTSWQKKDYAIASSDRGFLDESQCETMYGVYTKSETPQDFTQSGCFYTRMLINDEVPGILDRKFGGEITLCTNRSFSRVAQRENTLLHVTQGRAVKQKEEISFIRQAIILPAHFGGVKECWLGSRPVNDFNAQSENPQTIFINLGRAYLAIYPLTLTNHGRKNLIQLEKINNYEVISFINYKGAAKIFSKEQIQETFNGFVCEISCPDESGTFDDFRNNWTLGCIEDWWLSGNRCSRWLHNKHELLLNWLTEHNVLRTHSIDGCVATHPPLTASCFNPAILPFFQKPYLMGERCLGDRPMDIAWYPEMRWQK